MGIEVKAYKLGGGSLSATVYVQLGRHPIATQLKKEMIHPSGPPGTENDAMDSGGSQATEKIFYETIYVATAHGGRDDNNHISVVKQGGIRTDRPVTGDVYALCYNSLKEELIKEGYTITDVQ